MSADTKDFQDLRAEVQDGGICCRCGGCVAFCSAGEFNALRTGDDGARSWRTSPGASTAASAT